MTSCDPAPAVLSAPRLLGLVPAPWGLVGPGLEGLPGDLGLEATCGCLFSSARLRISSIKGRTIIKAPWTRAALSSPSRTLACHQCVSATAAFVTHCPCAGTPSRLRAWVGAGWTHRNLFWEQIPLFSPSPRWGRDRRGDVSAHAAARREESSSTSSSLSEGEGALSQLSLQQRRRLSAQAGRPSGAPRPGPQPAVVCVCGVLSPGVAVGTGADARPTAGRAREPRLGSCRGHSLPVVRRERSHA